jgi:23S rRNA pseudouridine955/2504/2580 synthase
VKHKNSISSLILWENDDFLVINKPPHIASLEDRAEPVNILSLARKHIDSAQLCHRLDKDTSGVLAIAKNPEAYRHLSIQIEKRKVTKIYHAVVDDIHSFENILIDKPILKMDEGMVKIAREGKDAQTFFSSIRSYKFNTLVECRPVTGRMHQIRIHLTCINAPITGDLMYGGKMFYLSSVKKRFNMKKDTDEQPLMKRMALHAFSLSFESLAGEEVKIEAPYPKDFQALVKQLESNS